MNRDAPRVGATWPERPRVSQNTLAATNATIPARTSAVLPLLPMDLPNTPSAPRRRCVPADAGPCYEASTRFERQGGVGSTALAVLRNHAEAAGLDEPMPTLAAGGHHHALMLPHYSKNPAFPPTEPLGTVSTRDRFALVTDMSGESITVRNCRFRMLRWDESAAAQCLPLQDGYVIVGTGEERTAQAGNAVSMNASMWLGRAGAHLLEPGQAREARETA